MRTGTIDGWNRVIALTSGFVNDGVVLLARGNGPERGDRPLQLTVTQGGITPVRGR